jgi:hypothetical protein
MQSQACFRGPVLHFQAPRPDGAYAKWDVTIPQEQIAGVREAMSNLPGTTSLYGSNTPYRVFQGCEPRTLAEVLSFLGAPKSTPAEQPEDVQGLIDRLARAIAERAVGRLAEQIADELRDTMGRHC